MILSFTYYQIVIIFVFISANSRLVFGREPPFTTTLLAAVDIPKGAEITGSYLDPLMPAVTRRPMLSFGW